MTFFAFDRTLFKKVAVIGKGFKRGYRKYASTTPRGHYLFVNGIHKIPEISEIIEKQEMRSVKYPYLMDGMCDGGGEIKYWIAKTDWEYVLLAGVKLDDSGNEDYAIDIASMVFKDKVPFPETLNKENITEFAGELLIAHYTHFLGKDGGVDFKNSIGSEINNSIKSVIDFYIMNVCALNQTLFKKGAVIGKGFKGGDRKYASTTPRGYHLFINGIHEFPKISEIIEKQEMGSVRYPYLMDGMCDGGGEIKYWIAKTEWEYVLLVGVKLDDSGNGNYAIDIASMVFKDRVPLPETLHKENITEIARELLIAHYTHFLGKDGGVDFKNSIGSEINNFINSVIDFYITNADNEVNTTLGDGNLSDEMKKFLDEMHNVSDD